MGRLKNLFRGKEKSTGPPSPNSYDQQQPDGQSPVIQNSPSAQYNGNLSYNYPQRSPSGALQNAPPNPYAQGPPPSYSAGTPPLASNGRSPNVPPYSQNFPSNTRYPTEKQGASDGFGANRYESRDAPQYGYPAASPAQSQRGYGNFDTQGGGSFANNFGPPKQPSPSSYGQAGISDGADGQSERPEMTEQEMEDAEVDQIKAETNYIRGQTVESSRRVLGEFRRAKDLGQWNKQMLAEQGDHIDRTEASINQARKNADIAGLHARDLQTVSGGMISSIGDKSRLGRKQERIEATHKEADKRSQQAMQDDSQWQLGGNPTESARQQTKTLGAINKPKRTDLLFEADSEQEEAEDEFDRNMSEAYDISKDLHQITLDTGRMLEFQNRKLGRIMQEADIVGDKVQKEQTRLDTILRK